MASMDEFREIRGDGTVIISINNKHIDRVFEAIGDELPIRMTDFWGRFTLLWEDVYFEPTFSKWYFNLVDLLESIEEEFNDEHFSIEAAVWCLGSIEYTSHGTLGGFEPVIEYNMYGKEVDPEQFAKEE